MSTATLPRAMSSEWIKLKSIRSTRWTVALFVVLDIGIAMLIAAAVSKSWATMAPADKATFDATDASLKGLAIGQLIIAVLGVLAITAEYSSGTIRATLTAVPKRLTALSAKTLVFAALATVSSIVTVFGGFFATQALLHSTGISTTIGAHDVAGALVGTTIYLVLLGLIAVGVGTIVRSTSAAITSMVGLVFVLPLVVSFLPGHWNTNITKYLPMSFGQQLSSVHADPQLLSPTASLVMMAVYAAVALAAGGFFLVRRDA